jgi:spermidine synthase
MNEKSTTPANQTSIQDNQIGSRDKDTNKQAWGWQALAIVFITSACIMVLELVAGRMIAPYVGVSLYTWTSVIGIVLAGISLGNYLGGKMADRWASLQLLGGLILLAGMLSLAILSIDWVGRLPTQDWPLILEILFITGILFFLPSIILGMVSPLVAKLAVRDLASTGSIVGKIYSVGALGSIIGTFATGFFLISWLGTHMIVMTVAIVLAGLGVLLIVSGRTGRFLAVLLLISWSLMVTIRPVWLEGPCTSETNYFCIRVSETTWQDEKLMVLRLDRLVHSYSSPDNPTQLKYIYEKIYAEATQYQADKSGSLRTLFIGGGGYTLPRYIEALYPDSEIDVIEIDPGVTRIAYELLGLDPGTEIQTFNEDGRIFLERKADSGYDLIFGDAFNDFSVPYHLTTDEFNQRVRAWLAPGGLYVVNIIDGPSGEFLRSYVHTLQQTFRYVYLVPSNEEWRESVRSTFVIIATDEVLQITDLLQGNSGSDNRLLTNMLSEPQTRAVLDEGRKVLLTDDYAPVDQMLAPVFGGR